MKRAQKNRRETRQIKGKIIIQSRRAARERGTRLGRGEGLNGQRYKKNSPLYHALKSSTFEPFSERKFNVAPLLYFPFHPPHAGDKTRSHHEFPPGFSTRRRLGEHEFGRLLLISPRIVYILYIYMYTHAHIPQKQVILIPDFPHRNFSAIYFLVHVVHLFAFLFLRM